MSSRDLGANEAGVSINSGLSLSHDTSYVEVFEKIQP